LHNQQRRQANGARHSAQSSLKTQLYATKLDLKDVEAELSTLGQGKEAKKAKSQLAAKKKALNAQMKSIRAASSNTLRIVKAELDSRRETCRKARTSGKENISPCAASGSSSPEDHSSDDECVPTPTRSCGNRVVHSPSPEVSSSDEAPMAMDVDDPPFLDTLTPGPLDSDHEMDMDDLEVESSDIDNVKAKI
jgi:hypothetical protein